MSKLWIAVLVLLLVRAEGAIALEPGKKLEHYVSAAWTVDRGLPQSSVFGVTQSRDGYVWLATQEGFVRFDGARFKIYDRSFDPQMGSHFSVAIRSTRDGSLYVGTFGGGLIRLRGDQLDVLTEAHGLPSSFILTLLESADGSLWIGTSSGLARLVNGSIAPLPLHHLSDETITALAEDISGRLWIGTESGIASFRDGTLSWHDAAAGFPAHGVVSLSAGEDGSVWIGTSSGLFRHRAGETRDYGHVEGLKNVLVTAVYEDRTGTLWVGKSEGFGRLVDGRLEFLSDRLGAVSTFFEDAEGNLWVGRMGGLIRLADGVVVAYSTSDGLLGDDVKTVTADDSGNVWIGTGRGVQKLDSSGITTMEGFCCPPVRSVIVARDGSLWVGTATEGLSRMQHGRITRLTSDDGLPTNGVMALFEDRRGTLWVGTSGGLARVVDGRVETTGLPSSIAGEAISVIAQSRDGAIWIGTHEHGLTRLSGQSVSTLSTRNGLSSDFVASIYEDPSGAIWIGTSGGGLNRLKEGKLSPVTSRHGLQDDTIFSILPDAGGNLWMSCNKGIFRASLADLHAVADGTRPTLYSAIYGRSDGMKSRECNGGMQPVAWKTGDGRMWFATTGGVAMINPAETSLGGPIARALVEEIHVDDEKLPTGTPVPPGQRRLEFHYTSPTFRTPDKLRFQYRLDGFEDEWTDAGTRRIAYYTNVPPGHYSFRVRVFDGEGAMTSETAAALEVQPFFHETPLFWILIALLVAAAILAAVQWRIRLVRASAERFKLLFDRNLAGVYRARIDGRILDCNQAGLRILGFSSLAELNDRTIFDSYSTPSDAEDVVRRLRTDGAVSGVETSLRRTDGTPIWVLQNISLAAAPQGHEILEATLIDITDRKRAEEQIRYQAFHDALTDLPNRTLFKERLAMAVAHAERRGRQAAVLFLDLDRFKLINDTLGHTIGDHLLQGMADRLKACVRPEDSVARVGGDEFTILLMDMLRPKDAMVVAQKILDVVARPITVDGHVLFVTCSIGISMSPADGVDAETLLKNADNALYRAKEAGKNNFQLCTPSMTQLAAERLTLENALRQALDRKEFLVVYQPQYDLRTRRIVAVEALLRWDRPGIGIVGPADFITAAEESRLIVPIGEFVLETSAQHAKSWGEEFPVRLAVNVSAAQFRPRQLVRSIRGALQELSLDPTRLEVEITESTAMLNPELTAEILADLKRLGVSIVIDDFGIGHSSLNYLKRFPIDGLKIDRTFVQDMTSDTSDAGIVAAIIAMANALKLRVTAEGVETEEQLAFLEANGCSTIQGYLLSRPVPSAAIGEMLRSEIAFSAPPVPHTA